MARYLLDTSIILRLVNPLDAQHSVARDAALNLKLRGDEPVLANQVLYEFWTVATRPTSVNGLGWTPKQSASEMAALLQGFAVLPEPQTLFATWLSLVTTYSVSGKRSHDLRLIAWALDSAVPFIVTFNIDDFKPFTEITAIYPADL